MDSNHRRHKPADLQSAPFGHSGIRPCSKNCRKDMCKNPFMQTLPPQNVRIYAPCSHSSLKNNIMRVDNF